MFKTSIIYFLIRAINGVLGLATVFILTRLLSPEQYGVYALALATIGLFASVLYQWIAVTIARFYAIHKEDPSILIVEGNKLFFKVSSYALVTAGVYFYFANVDGIQLGINAAIVIGVIATGLHNLGLQVANASGRPINYGLLTVTRATFTLCAAVSLVQLGYGSIGAVFGVAVGGAASVAIFRIRHAKRDRAGNKELRKQMIVYGLPLTLTYLSTMILDVSDRFMIGWWLGTPAVAGYAAAYDLTQQVIGAIMNVLFLATYPRITAEWETGGVTAARNAMLPLSKAILLAIPLLAGTFIGGANEISNLAFGKSIAIEAAKVVPWIAFSIAIGCFKSYYLDISFQLAKTTKTQLRITAAMALTNIVLNIVLMPYWGVIGAAISTAFAFSLGALLSWWFGRNLEIYCLKKTDALKTILVFAITIAGTYFSPRISINVVLDLCAMLMFGCLAYVAGLILTNLVGSREALIRRAVFIFVRVCQ